MFAPIDFAFLADNRLAPDELLLVAEACRGLVARYAPHPHGFTTRDFASRVNAYRVLSADDQHRVQALLIKMPSLSCSVGARGRLFFFAASNAPAGAFNVRKRLAA